MSQDKNLINQIKYNKSVKNNLSSNATQEIPYTALSPLPAVNDNVLFSIVDQNNSVNNKMTVLQLYDYIRALRTDRTLYKTWTVADGNTLTLTEDELNSNQKIIITTEDLSSFLNFALVIPDTWDDTQGISIEVDYKAFTDENDSYKLRISKGTTFGFYYDAFVLVKGNSPIYVGEQNNYKVKFDLLNGQLRNPFGLIGYLLSTGTSSSPVLPKANNVGVTYKIKINSVNNAGTIQPSNVTGNDQSIIETDLGSQPLLSIEYSNSTAQTVKLPSYEFRCAVKNTGIVMNSIRTYLVKDDNGNKNALVVGYDTPTVTPLGSQIVLASDGDITFSGIQLAIYFEGEL